MSLKLLIADDEYFIRQRLKKIIPWEALDLTFAGEAENGRQVIEHLKISPVDLLLLDIKMPEMSGIETAKYIKEHFPSVHILILSGYNNFEYAQTAIRYGVKEYLLKPISADDLKLTLTECIRNIHSEQKTRHSLKRYEHFHLCSMLTEIRDGRLSYADLCRQYPEFENFSHSIYCSIYTSGHTNTALTQLAAGLRSQNYLCEYIQESEYIYMLQVFLADKDRLLHIGSHFTDFIAAQKNYVFMYIENAFCLTSDWKPHYTRCLHLLKERYFSSESNLCISYARPKCPEFSEELLAVRKQFINVLHSQNKENLIKYLDELFASIGEKKNSDYLYLVTHEIFVAYHVYFHVPENPGRSITELIDSILDTEYSLETLKQEILFYGLQCIQKMNTLPSDIALCRKIMDYINTYYTDPSLSVAQVAARFQLHPSYLGGIFKKVQHISILQYITELRISAAQSLLKENSMKISEIAEATGYSDVYYFSKKFKKSAGCSPKEYAAKFS